MGDGGLCRCGHDQGEHRSGAGVCGAFADGIDDPFLPRAGEQWRLCGCRLFDDSVLPPPGERLVFGEHRLRSADAETAEAWPPLGTVRKRFTDRARRRMRSA